MELLMKVMKDAEQRVVIIVATRDKLNELTATAEIGPLINSAIDSRWSYLGSLGKIGRNIYRRSEVKLLAKMSGDEVLTRFNKSMDLGADAICLAPSDAQQSFDFGVGHFPKNGDVYIQHPISQDRYISPIEFSRTICAEKEAAFLTLAAALGARSIKLTSIQSNDTKGIFNSKFKAPEIAAVLGFSANFDKSGNIIKEVVKEFNRPSFKKPYIPSQLVKWVDFDPDLRTMAFDRVEANAARSNIKLEFSQNLGLGGELSARIADRGFSAGGKFNAVARSIWSFEVEYFDLSTV
jgi:hypothetical protein